MGFTHPQDIAALLSALAIQNGPPPVHCNTDRTSQVPLERWHDFIADATLAEAILDRLVHNAYKIIMIMKGGGESMRKWYAKKDDPDITEKW